MSIFSRLSQHRYTAHWWTSINVIQLEHFKTRSEALRAEKLAIATEMPKYNVMMNQWQEEPEDTEPVLSLHQAAKNLGHTTGGIRLLCKVAGIEPPYTDFTKEELAAIQAAYAKAVRDNPKAATKAA